MADFEERRRHPRLEETLPVTYRVHESSAVLEGWVKNLSAGGAALVTEMPVPLYGIVAELRFALPPIKQQPAAEITVAAAVLRTEAQSTSDGQTRYLSGLHFLNLEGEAFEAVRLYVYYRLMGTPVEIAMA